MPEAMTDQTSYLRDGAAIYRRSFAIIRAEADLSRFTPEQVEIVVRMIHACGQVDIAEHIVFGGDLVAAARAALAAGAAKPAAILGIPVGFVGAAESKEALAANAHGAPFLLVRGRIGGSAIAAAAVNALARPGL